MKRPTGWKPNPQAMAAVSTRMEFTGSDLLGSTADTDTWLTPRFILDHLGAFDMDPCSAEQNTGWTGCARSLTIADDGLNAEWVGRVFMNPPFSNTGPWLRKHAAHGSGISLVPASVESRVWRDVVWKVAIAVLLLHGRTRFCNPDGTSTQGRPLRSIALIAWSQSDAVILEAMPLAGVLLKNWRQI